MNQTKEFFWCGAAKRYAWNLRLRGYLDALATAKHRFGPRDCFDWPFGWVVTWTAIAQNPK